LEETATKAPPATWLIRIPEVFSIWEPEILGELGATAIRKPGRDYLLIRLENPQAIRQSKAARFLSWNLPVHHSWPCDPSETPGFIEKAAQALMRKFGENPPQAIFAGAFDPGATNRYFRTLASNLRGRTLQLFPPVIAAIRDAATQDPTAPTLYCIVGREGLFCGVQSPQASNGFHPGGSKFIRQNSPGTISRAGAKIAEALHHLQLHRPLPPAGGHWLELGASPGGMTAELLARGYQVTAVDRAPLDPRLENTPGLHAALADAATYQPAPNARFDAILSDMNGDAHDSITHVIRLSRHLRSGGIAIFTMKLPGVTHFADVAELENSLTTAAARAGLQRISATHLTYNRREFTLFFERGAYAPEDREIPV
jgi:SAM-dependent methyltransferase